MGKMQKGPKPSKKDGAAQKKAFHSKAANKVKQPSAKALRVKKNIAPKVIENTKSVIFLRGTRSSEIATGLLKDLYSMRKPFAKMLQRKNDNMHPFEDASSLEFICQKNDCSIFTIASHSKKRPDNLTIGRMFDGHLLDMVEVGIDACTTIQELHKAFPDATVSTLFRFSFFFFCGVWCVITH
jgi:ribosome production factor 2